MSLKLSPLFTDGMVLQRDKELTLWGDTNPNSEIEINFQNKRYLAKADEKGVWKCKTDKFPVGGPFVMKFESDGQVIQINDVMMGDVWFCSGQSNMELMLNRTRCMYPEDVASENKFIRQIKIPQIYNFKAPMEDLSDGKWETFSPQTADNFTAVGYFFAKKLYEKYQVPIGLIACAVGGTPISAWLSREMLSDYPNELRITDELSDEFIKNTTEEFEKCSNEYYSDFGGKDLGFKENWAAPDYNDIDWEEVDICNQVQGIGSYWYRKTIEVPKKLWGKSATLYFGTAVDSNTFYINGQSIGNVAYRYPPIEYNFTLPEGKMTVAIRLICNGAEGGFTPGKNRFISCENHSINLEGKWKRRKGAENDPMTKAQPFFQYKPTGLYNGMVYPVTKWNVKGFLWYQGESDAGEPKFYSDKFKKLISSYRKLWNDSELPFLFVQLAHYDYCDYKLWEQLRAEQKKCLEIKNTGMAANYDTGEFNDLHPQNKRDIGERLARLAMRISYGETLPPSCFEICGYCDDN